MDEDIEIPQYFICPISLQIMKDPVTAITGITYDRESIEHWLFTSNNTTCPVTNQPLSKDSDLTPNHTLRRLIQAWCTDNASHGIDRIPTPKPCLDRFHVIKLLQLLHQPELQVETLGKLEKLAEEHQRNRKCMVEAGLPKAMLLFILECYKRNQIDGLKEAFSILRFVPVPSTELKDFLVENDRIIKSLTWALGLKLEDVQSDVVSVIKSVLEEAGSNVLERLKPEFFDKIVGVIREKISRQGTKAALEVLLHLCPCGRNRLMMVESGAVLELIELELGSPEKKTTELILGILFHLCSCADGRAEFLSHGGAIAVVAERILTVSLAADDRAIFILWLICKFSGTNSVKQELLEVNAVLKLCMLLQIECASYLKDKAREILRLYTEEWKNSPCFNAPLLTRCI